MRGPARLEGDEARRKDLPHAIDERSIGPGTLQGWVSEQDQRSLHTVAGSEMELMNAAAAEAKPS